MCAVLSTHMKCNTSETAHLMQTWLCSQACAFMGELHSYLHIDYTSPVPVCCSCFICTQFFLPMKSSAEILWDSYHSSLHPDIHISPRNKTLICSASPLNSPFPSNNKSLQMRQFFHETSSDNFSLHRRETWQSPVLFPSPGVLGLGNFAAYHAPVLTCWISPLASLTY